jgi:hemerythrin
MDVTLEQSPATHDSAGIDKEHQVQIGMLTAFCSLLEKGATPIKIQEVLGQLIEYSEVHFMSEQLLMRMYAYPDYEDHVQDHETMIEHLNRIKNGFRYGEKAAALDAASEMRSFLLAHIGSRDQAFSNYLSRMQTSSD